MLGYPRPSILGIGGPASLTRGLLSAIRQENGVTYVQTDATVNHGNSGGPVLNMRGNVVGVVDFGLKDSVGLNFAIATESIQAFLGVPAAIAQAPSPTRAATPVPTPTPHYADAGSFGSPLNVDTSGLQLGSQVAAMTGGMGRTFDGGYAE